MKNTFFKTLAEQTPFAILDGKLHQVSEKDPESGILKLGMTSLGLVHAAHVDDLERFYTMINRDELEGIMKEYLQQRLQKEIRSQQEFEQYMGDNKTVQFIVKEVFPHFMDRDDDIEELVHAEEEGRRARLKEETGLDDMLDTGEQKEITLADVQRVKQELIREIEEEYARYEQPEEPGRTEKPPTEELDELDQLLTQHYTERGLIEPEPRKRPPRKIETGEGLMELIGHDKVLVMDGKVYTLEKTEEDQDITIAIGRKRYAPKHTTTADSIEAEYQRSLEKKAKIAAVEKLEDQVKQIEEARSKHKGIEGIAKRDEFRTGDIGFLKRGGEYYVFLQVPKFAMKHPNREQYFAFEPCRVAVRVNYSEGEFYTDSKPVVVEAYRHPFLEGGGEFQGICNLSGWRNGYDPAMQVVKKLSDAKNVIMNGMTVRSFRSHGGTDIHDSHYWSDILKDKLKGREITKNEAKKKGYQITNFLWAGGNNGR